jgi:hypothetical protein
MWKPPHPKFTEAEKKKKDEAEKLVKDLMWDQLNIKIAASGGGPTHSGSSDTGNNARKFFSEAQRKIVVNMFLEKRSEVEIIIQGLSVILRVVSSDARVHDMDGFRDLCKDTYTTILQTFPYALVSLSVHRLLAHSAEAIESNGHRGLKRLSEEGLEASNKLVRFGRTYLARNVDASSNMTDVLKYIWIQGAPPVRNQKLVTSCTACGKTGHTIRSCVKGQFGPLSTDEALMASLVDGYVSE